MISIDTARNLKEAGLKWEPQLGDWYYLKQHDQIIFLFDHEDKTSYELGEDEDRFYDYIFAPTLSQLLAEIERLGWAWELGILYLNGKTWYVIEVASRELIKKDTERWEPFKADTPDDAAAQAALWILEKESQTSGAGGE